MGAGARAENPVTLVLHLHCILFAPELEEELEPQPRQAGKSVDENLHS